MLKMIIVDDEKIIRETIHSLIDWNSLGIDVVAVCKDGIEAFDCILDEYPDIVMTDIKMPGLSGLDLIEKVRAAQLNTEFIILSGYGEFEFARTAMRYGVKHYLLKPSNETEITQVIVSCVETCKSKTASRVDSLLTQLFLTEMPPEKLLQMLSISKIYSLIRFLPYFLPRGGLFLPPRGSAAKPYQLFSIAFRSSSVACAVSGVTRTPSVT